MGDALASDPDASPIYADVRGLAATLIKVSENEIMLSGAPRLAERLSEQRVRTTLEVWPGMFHVWYRLAGHLTEADEALDNAFAFLAAFLIGPVDVESIYLRGQPSGGVKATPIPTLASPKEAPALLQMKRPLPTM